MYIDLVSKIWKNGRKTTILGKIRGVVPVPNRVVPVPIEFSPPVPVPIALF